MSTHSNQHTKKPKKESGHIWDTPDGHNPFIHFLQKIAPLSKQVMHELDQVCFPVVVQKNKFLLKPGAQADHLYFITKGVIRGCIKEDGKMITTWISEENEVVGSIRALGTGALCQEYLQAIETTHLIAFSYAFTEHLFHTYPETNVIGRRILEYSYREAEERAYICRIKSAEKKYRRFRETRPHLIERISLKYIASFLGITLETLSRVRSRLK